MDGESDSEVAARVVARLRELAEALPDSDRRALALLLAPGIQRVYDLLDDAESDVFGFRQEVPPGLAIALARALRDSHIEVRGLTTEEGR